MLYYWLPYVSEEDYMLNCVCNILNMFPYTYEAWDYLAHNLSSLLASREACVTDRARVGQQQRKGSHVIL